MRTIGLVLALMVVASLPSFAVTYTLDVYEGVQQIALQGVPFDPAVRYLDSAGVPKGVLKDLSSTQVTGRIQKWDASFGFITWPTDENFNMLLGEGYVLTQEFDADEDIEMIATCSYEGIEDGVPDTAGTMTDMWVSLPGIKEGDDPEPDFGGSHLFGYPFAHTMSVGKVDGHNIYFTNGIERKIWKDAVTALWVESVFTGWDPTLGGGVNVGYTTGADDFQLYPGNSYWVNTRKDNLAMIIPAYWVAP